MLTPALPCPFCGSRDTSVDELGATKHPFFAVSCDRCEATGPIAQSYEGAVESWNLRTDKPDDGH